MRRILFYVGRIPIYSYTAMLYLGIVCGIYAQAYMAGRMGLDPVRTVSATLLLLVPALGGARLLWVVSHWRAYRGDVRRIAKGDEGGAAMYGGLLLAVPLSPLVLFLLDVPFAAYWDTAAFTMLIGMIVTRVGCLLNGCCAGKPTSHWLSLHLPDHRGVWAKRIPTQILEASWGSMVLAGAVLLWDSVPFAGALFLYTLGTYSIGRIALERMRERQPRIRGVLVQGALSTAFIVLAVGAFAFAWLR